MVRGPAPARGHVGPGERRLLGADRQQAAQEPGGGVVLERQVDDDALALVHDRAVVQDVALLAEGVFQDRREGQHVGAPARRSGLVHLVLHGEAVELVAEEGDDVRVGLGR